MRGIGLTWMIPDPVRVDTVHDIDRRDLLDRDGVPDTDTDTDNR